MFRSPIHNFHLQNNAKFKQYGDWELPSEISGWDAEYNAIRENVGIIDISGLTKIKISGENVLEFLDEICVSNMNKLYEGKILYTALCRDDGTIVSLICVWRDRDHYLITCDPEYGRVVWEHLNAFKKDNIIIEDISRDYGCISFIGVNAISIPKSIVGEDILGLPFGGFMHFNVDGKEYVCARFGLTGEFEYRICAKSEEMSELWTKAVDLAREVNAQLCGLDVLETLWLEMKSINLQKDACAEATLFQLQLQWMIDFRKEKFVGREAIFKERQAGVNKKLMLLTFDPKVQITKDSPILLENEKIGFIQHVGYSPKLNSGIATAYISPNYAWVGLEFETESIDGRRVVIKTISAPSFLTKSVIEGFKTQ